MAKRKMTLQTEDAPLNLSPWEYGPKECDSSIHHMVVAIEDCLNSLHLVKNLHENMEVFLPREEYISIIQAISFASSVLKKHNGTTKSE
jgi:hypothetical protein